MQVAHAFRSCDVADRLTRASDPHAIISGLRAQIAQLEVTIERLTGGDMVDDLSRLFPTQPPAKLLILAMLVRYPCVTREQLWTALYGMRNDPPGERVLDVHISRLRATLPQDTKILTWRGRGWQIEAGARARIRADLARLEVADAA